MQQKMFLHNTKNVFTQHNQYREYEHFNYLENNKIEHSKAVKRWPAFTLLCSSFLP